MAFIKKSTSEIPEVAQFEEAKARLKKFTEAHQGLFNDFAQLTNEFNTAREAADKAVRSQRVSCGDWDYYSKEVRFDGKAMYDALGQEAFMKFGGSINTVSEFTVDKDRAEASIRSGDLPASMTASFRREIDKYHSPSDIKIPV